MFTKDEIWENYTYFIKQVARVAEEAGVRIGIHPDDPPVPVLAGVPRCIFSNFEGYKRALEIANSPNVGICLCCGTWLEGGRKLTGKDPEEMIRHFGAEKIWKIHFRNVSAPLPHFVETFMDNGYYDMSKIMRALQDVGFDGIVILDHSPSMVGGNYTQTAYGFAYMKGLLNGVNSEARGCCASRLREDRRTEPAPPRGTTDASSLVGGGSVPRPGWGGKPPCASPSLVSGDGHGRCLRTRPQPLQSRERPSPGPCARPRCFRAWPPTRHRGPPRS